MPTFQYKAISAKGKTVTGTLEAISRKHIVQKLKADGLKPVRIDAEGDSAVTMPNDDLGNDIKSSSKKKRPLFKLKKASPDAIALAFMKKVYQLHKSGMPIGDTIKNLSQRLSDPTLQELATNLWNEISEGKQLAVAIRQFPDIFDPSVSHLIEAGEATGDMAPVIGDIVKQIHGRIDLKKRIIAGLTYPALLCSMALGVAGMLLFYLMPKMEGMMESMGSDGEMSLPSRILIATRDIVTTEGPFILGGLVIALLFILRWRKTKSGQRIIDAWLLRVPFVSGIILNIDICRCSSLLKTLLSSGVNITEALRLTVKSIRNSILRNRFQASRTLINDGAAFAVAFRKHKLFTDTDLDIIGVGEQTGSTVDCFNEIEMQHNEELDKQFKLLTNILAGAALGFAFIMVLLIVLSIILSVMDLSKTIMSG